MDITSQRLTVGEAATYAHVDPSTIRRWIDKGLLTFERTPGGHYRLTREDIDQAFTASRQS